MSTGGRRNPVPKPPLPTGNNNANNNNNGAGAPPTTGLHAGAKEFVPSFSKGGSSSSTNNTPSSLPNPMAKALSATAVSFQPKFSGSGNNSNNNPTSPNAPDPSPSAIKSATATICDKHATEVAKTSKMRATAEGFTPTRSNEGSFPTSPDKNTPASIPSAAGKKSNGQNTFSASPPSLSNNNNNNKSSTKNPPPPPHPSEQKKQQQELAAAEQQKKQQQQEEQQKEEEEEKPEYPEPFKNSKLALSGEDKEFNKSMETPAPKETMHLNCSWTLYALDQSQRFGPVLGGTGNGAQPQQESFVPEKLYTVQDVEGFWRLQRSIPTPSSRTPKFTYYFFRRSIYPSWEEPRNKNGGTFQFVVWDAARGNTDKELANDIWTLMLLGLIGESLAESKIVNGVCLKVRKSVTIELWTNNCDQKQITSFMASVKEMISKRMPAFPVKQLDGLDFTSNATNVAKSAPPPPPPSGSPNSPHPTTGGKGNKHHHHHPPPPPPPPPATGPDFKI